MEPSARMSANVAAIVMAAGQGTRMKSGKAKVLHAVCEEPMVSYPVRLAQALGAAPVVLVVGHQAEAVEAEVTRRFPDGVAFALQAEQKGTGHAVMMGLGALPDFEGRIFILSGDVPLLTRGTLERLAASVGDADPLALVSFLLDDPTGYGRLIRDGEGRLARIVEHKDASEAERAVQEVNAGIYYVDAAFLRSALARLGNDNAQGEYYLTDIVGIALGDGHTVRSVLADPQEQTNLVDDAAHADALEDLRARLDAHMTATADPYLGQPYETVT